MSINPNQVRAGAFNHTVGLVGIQPGKFLIRGLFFNVRPHDMKKNMDKALFNEWVAGMIAAYDAKIQELEKELQADPNNAGLKLNIARKKKIRDGMKAFVPAGNADLDVAKTAVDKLIADDALFALAADLISLAASLLGYDSIPLPGLGTVLRGAKAAAAASKLPKLADALKKAAELAEAADKIKEAKEKAEKLKELKDAMDKVQEALKGGG